MCVNQRIVVQIRENLKITYNCNLVTLAYRKKNIIIEFETLDNMRIQSSRILAIKQDNIITITAMPAILSSISLAIY